MLHWTEQSTKDYVFRIMADFIAQLEKKMETENITQDELAERLKITKGRVSQVLNHPGNISLSILAKYARALGMKMSIVAYEDADPENIKGPVNSEIFKTCWESCGKPRDFWALQEMGESRQDAADVISAEWRINKLAEKVKEMAEGVSAANSTLRIYSCKIAPLGADETLAFDLREPPSQKNIELAME
jgi:transcriptional regulator with XRE-family HTH domain